MSLNFKGMKSVNLNMKSKVIKNVTSPLNNNVGMNKIIEEGRE